ncbi:unnamed protein product [Cylindrotheca closterium]|uniref:Integrase catalytic domain-containing protein n=1 Tax=Cylindrotheca closterium TaxID=2856 RepID=A0AAD2JLD5_9STRA|nr:unnamed protein product [Cylindrotheca closterium]
MSGLCHLHYVPESQGLTLDIWSAYKSVAETTLCEWACILQLGLYAAVIWYLYSSLKYRNDSVLFRGLDDEYIQPDQHLKRKCQSWKQSIPRWGLRPSGVLYALVAPPSMPRVGCRPSGVLFAHGEAYVNVHQPRRMYVELPSVEKPRRKITVELPSAYPWWCGIRRYRYPRQYHLRLRIARVKGDPRKILRRQRKEGVREQKQERKRQERRRKEDYESRRPERRRKGAAQGRKKTRFRLLKKLVRAKSPKEQDVLQRELKSLKEEDFWGDYDVKQPSHWESPSDEELLEDYERTKNRYLHHSYLQYESQYGVVLDELLADFRPNTKHHAMKDVLSSTFLQPVSSLPRVTQALIAADDLVSDVSCADRLRSVYINVDSKGELPIVIDTGASFSLTPNLEDFVTKPIACGTKSLNGLSSITPVLGIGEVEWKIRDMHGTIKSIRVSAYYVPDTNIRLLSPQSYFQEHGKGEVCFDSFQVKMTLPDGDTLFFPYQAGNNLPMMLTANRLVDEAAHIITDEEEEFLPEDMSVFLNVAHENNANLTKAEKKLLLWHAKTGHANMNWLLKLCKWTKTEGHPVMGPLPAKKDEFKSCKSPKCAVCQLAKQRRRSPRSDAAQQQPGSKTGKQRKEKEMMVDNLKPGDKVSIDQYLSAVPGRLAHTFGEEKTSKQYVGGTLFVDHATGFVHAKHQTSTGTRETVKSKHSFESEVGEYGHKVKSYRADNHPFSSKGFLDDIESHKQTIDYSAVGAKHQNGVAERAIQTITTWARAMLLHQMLHWPDEADHKLWPFAMDHAVYLWNHLPREDTKQAPIELMGGAKIDHHQWFKRLHVWGSPVYVLDPRLQDGKKIPKWDVRARRGMYVGVSPTHSSLVSRVLNLQTGYVSPQYHVVIDDLFTTVPNADQGGLFDVAEFDATTWQSLVETGYEKHLDEEGLASGSRHDRRKRPTLANEWLNPVEKRARKSRRAACEAQGGNIDAEDNPASAPPNPPSHDDLNDDDSDGEPAIHSDDEQSVVEGHEAKDEDPGEESESEGAAAPSLPTSRVRKKNPKYFGDDFANVAELGKKKIRHSALDRQFFANLKWAEAINTIKGDNFGRMWRAACEPYHDHDTGLQDDLHPMILAAKANSEDNPNWNEAMNGPLRQGYWKAAEDEIEALKKKESWDVVDRTEGMNVLPSTWAFKCKRYPDGSVRKLKARFCVRGDRQIQDVDFHETWAPVVNWNTVRLMLILSQVLGLSTKQVDYTTAFLHAPIEEEVYVAMPRGFSEPNKVLKLKRCLYGLKQSPRNFFQFLQSNLEDIGFEPQTEVDPCLFISKNCICLVYVDDTLFFSPEQKYIDEAIAKLREKGMELEEEASVAGFLGVHIERNEETGAITLTQKGLIKRIVDALGVQKTSPTPAHVDPLAIDAEGDLPDGLYNYASVVGMLLYLSGHSRPDICFAVSQVARFIHGNRRSHEVAIERIGQYLKGTMDKGLILTPREDFDIDCYVDADFAGLWNVEEHTNPESVRSRAGYAICICGCPIIWKSQLMRPIAASTMEAEYNALALSMRDVLPLQELFKTIGHAVGIGKEFCTQFSTTIHEDNQGAQKLACMEPGHHTPRSKSFWVRSHWFRQYLKPTRTKVVYIKTNLQKADILTKGLTKDKFLRCRKLLCGW